MRRRFKVVAGAVATVVAAGALTLPGAEASGDSTVVVRGSALPEGSRSQLNLVGCDSVFGRTAEPVAPTIGVVPGRPGNRRSLGFDLVGGNAIGSVSYVDRVAATTTAGMSVHADAGTTGVAYVGYQAPKDVGTSLMWVGRAPLAVSAGVWTPVNVTGQGFAWTQYDMSTQQPIGGVVGSSGISAFTQAMGGDGAGFYMVGFGCDGNAFNTDSWRIGTSTGVTTYDFEGFTTRTTISGPDAAVEPGQRVTLTGSVVDGSGAPVTGRVVLEAKTGDGPWETVDVAPGPNPSVVVRPEESTTYRWKLYDRARFEGSVSAPMTIKVVGPEEPSEHPSANPSDPPAGDEPSGDPSTPVTSDAPRKAPAAPVQPPADTPTPAAETPPAEPAAQETPPAVEHASEPATPASDPPAAEQSAPAESAEGGASD
ncbi:hypothetical protein [Nocardioides endophyticus]|uniref:hypothetical protein n=1 Tax=Nocardioides endophyticus TaxID=1353775 RepID=UPI0031E5A713